MNIVGDRLPITWRGFTLEPYHERDEDTWHVSAERVDVVLHGARDQWDACVDIGCAFGEGLGRTPARALEAALDDARQEIARTSATLAEIDKNAGPVKS